MTAFFEALNEADAKIAVLELKLSERDTILREIRSMLDDIDQSKLADQQVILLEQIRADLREVGL